MAINVELLSAICKTPGASGFEQQIRTLIMKEVAPLVDEVSVDNMGNVIAFRKGKSAKKLMLAAHMDEIGFIVSHIDEDGFVRFHPVGGFDPKTLTSQRVLIHGEKESVMGVMGSKPIHLMTAKERTDVLMLDDFFIDTGMKREKLVKLIEEGDSITRVGDLVEMGDCVNGKSLDNRVSVFILIEMLRALKKTKLPCNTYAVFTVQEEIGLRGAMVAGNAINPDYGINIDTTIAYDVPPAKDREVITKLGKGTAIKIKDRSVICDYRMVRFMKKMAKENKIDWQTEVLPKGGTDTGSIQRMSKGGAIVGAVSIPTRHIHQTVEMVHKKDVQDSIDLLKVCVKNVEKYDWSFK